MKIGVSLDPINLHRLTLQSPEPYEFSDHIFYRVDMGHESILYVTMWIILHYFAIPREIQSLDFTCRTRPCAQSPRQPGQTGRADRDSTAQPGTPNYVPSAWNTSEKTASSLAQVTAQQRRTAHATWIPSFWPAAAGI